MIPPEPKPLESVMLTKGESPDRPSVKAEDAFTPFQWAVLNRLDQLNENLGWACDLLREIRDRN